MAGEAADFVKSAADLAAQVKLIQAAEGELARIAKETGATVAQVRAAETALSRQAADAARAEATAAKQAADAKKAAMAEAKKAAEDQAKATEAASKPTREFSGSLLEAGQSATRLPGPLGAVQDALGKLGPYGQAAAAALGVVTIAVTALTAAILGGMYAAISIVQQRAALLATFSALGGGAAAGKKTLEMVEELGQKLPFATEQIGAWAKSLQAAGVPAENLRGAIKAVAAAQALMGEAGGAAAQNVISKLAEGGKGADAMLKQLQEGAGRSNKMLAEMGLTSADVARELGKTPEQLKTATLKAGEMQQAIEKALQKRGSGALDQLGSTFPVMIQKVKEGLLSLFDGIDVGPFMSAVRSLFGEFTKGGNATKIAKPLIADIFQTLFQWATKAVTFLHDAFQTIEIVGLKVAIAIAPLVNKIRAFAASADFLRGLKVAFIGIGVAIAVASLPFILFGAVTLLVLAAIGTFVALAVRYVGQLAGRFMAAFRAIKAAVSSFKLPDLGAAAKNMITSFISAITGGIGQVVAAMSSVGAAAKQGLYDALGIHSPSRIAVEAATNVTTSFADTVDDGKDQAQSAFNGMVKVSDAQPGKRGAAGGGKSGAIDRLAAALDRVAGALDGAPGFREMLVAALEEATHEGAAT